MLNDKLVAKVLITVVSALLYVAGFGLLIRSAGSGLLGSTSNGGDVVLPVLISGAGFFTLGWFNSRSTIIGLIGAIIALIAGIPLAYLVLAPAMEWILTSIFPDTNIILSGSFSAAWFVLLPVILIEVVTDNVFQRQRWRHLIIGVILSLLFMWLIEFLTTNIGQSGSLDMLRLLIYTPVTWCLVVLSISCRKGV